MTKAKAAAEKAAAPAPAQPPAATPANPVHDEAGTQGPMPCRLSRIEDAQELPEVGPGIETVPLAFVPGAIRRFKSTDTDRRTMEVVGLHGSGLAKRHVADEEN